MKQSSKDDLVFVGASVGCIVVGLLAFAAVVFIVAAAIKWIAS